MAAEAAASSQRALGHIIHLCPADEGVGLRPQRRAKQHALLAALQVPADVITAQQPLQQRLGGADKVGIAGWQTGRSA